MRQIVAAAVLVLVGCASSPEEVAAANPADVFADCLGHGYRPGSALFIRCVQESGIAGPPAVAEPANEAPRPPLPPPSVPRPASGTGGGGGKGFSYCPAPNTKC